MATLFDLTPGFLALSHKERFELVRELRTLRRVATESPKPKRQSVPRGKLPIDDLTPEQAQQLLALLGELE
jgi:hypothetical protein